MNIKDYLQNRSALVDRALERWMPGEEVLPRSLHQAMRYSVFAGGKRLRPILMIAACESLGGHAGQVLHAACAMEMIHTYSLIHDDLPAMDDDDFRRGRPTNHKVYGEATAILAGDALLTEAFRILADAEANRSVPPATVIKVIELVARYAGSQGMVGGPVVYIHTHKTGGLILASVQVGALLGGANDSQVAAIKRFGGAAGLAFQIADDILDIVGDQQHLGKNVGSDQARGKATYPAQLGLDEARQRADELCGIAISALAPLGKPAEILQELARYIVNRDS